VAREFKMTNYTDLCRRLRARTHYYHNGEGLMVGGGDLLCNEAADALAALQKENEELRRQLDDIDAEFEISAPTNTKER
jgi:hypothetical protein